MTIFFTGLFAIASSFAIKFLFDEHWWVLLGIAIAFLAGWFLFMVTDQESDSYKNIETLEVLVKGVVPVLAVVCLVCSLLAFRRSCVSGVLLLAGALLLVYGEVQVSRHLRFVRGTGAPASGSVSGRPASTGSKGGVGMSNVEFKVLSLMNRDPGQRGYASVPGSYTVTDLIRHLQRSMNLPRETEGMAIVLEFSSWSGDAPYGMTMDQIGADGGECTVSESYERDRSAYS